MKQEILNKATASAFSSGSYLPKVADKEANHKRSRGGKEMSLFLTEQIPEDVRIAADIDVSDSYQIHLLRRTWNIPGLKPE